MKTIHHQFEEDKKPFVATNSGRKHKNFVDDPPLSVSEMYRRAVKGIPLSVPRPKDENIPLNNRFYNDDFDVLDVAIKNDKRLSEEERKKQLEANEKRKKDIEDFNAWKKQRELELNKLNDQKGE